MRSVEVDDVRDIEVVLGMVLGRLDPDAVPLRDASLMWQRFVSVAKLALSGATLMARRVEDSGSWKRDGARSAAEELSKLAGTSPTEARRMLDTSKRVKALPKTAQAMREGKLSVGKADAIADAATVAPESEDELLADAEATPLGDLQKRCLKAKAKDADAAYDRIRKGRYLKTYTDAEGAWNLRARGTVDDGSEFMRVLKPLIDARFDKARSEERREPVEAYAFDALMDLADQAAVPKIDGAKPKRAPAKYRGLIRIDHAALVRGEAEGDERCEIAGLGPIPVWRARELLGDAILDVVITKGVDVMNVTHLGRGVNRAQQVALWWKARACQRIDCTRTERLENDHREEWHKVHETRLDNIDPLCPHEHWLKTHEGWSLVEGEGRRAFVPPGDPRHPKNKPKDARGRAA